MKLKNKILANTILLSVVSMIILVIAVSEVGMLRSVAGVKLLVTAGVFFACCVGVGYLVGSQKSKDDKNKIKKPYSREDDNYKVSKKIRLLCFGPIPIVCVVSIVGFYMGILSMKKLGTITLGISLYVIVMIFVLRYKHGN